MRMCYFYIICVTVVRNVFPVGSRSVFPRAMNQEAAAIVATPRASLRVGPPDGTHSLLELRPKPE